MCPMASVSEKRTWISFSTLGKVIGVFSLATEPEG